MMTKLSFHEKCLVGFVSAIVSAVLLVSMATLASSVSSEAHLAEVATRLEKLEAGKTTATANRYTATDAARDKAEVMALMREIKERQIRNHPHTEGAGRK